MILKIVLLLTLVSTGLISGFFYAYSCSVNTGLGRLSDSIYLRAMQSINHTVLNPAFFISFFGTFILLPVATWLEYRLIGITLTFYILFACSLLYFFGVFLVTSMGNVPLNERLAHVDIDSASAETLKQQRLAFEGPWNRFHTVRTVLNIVVFGGAVWAVLIGFDFKHPLN